MTIALHNTLKGWTLFDLTLHEASLLASGMSENERKLALYCEADGVSWGPLGNILPQLDLKYKTQEKLKYPPLAEKNSAAEMDTGFFIIRPQKNYFPRLHRRIEKEFPLDIEAGQRVFSSTTIDLSEGGFLLKEVIPDWIAGYFIAKVYPSASKGETFFQVMCSLVEDQKNKKRIQVVSEESDAHYLRYKDWLATLE